jgi:hypothetical protein
LRFGNGAQAVEFGLRKKLHLLTLIHTATRLLETGLHRDGCLGLAAVIIKLETNQTSGRKFGPGGDCGSHAHSEADRWNKEVLSAIGGPIQKPWW